MAFPAYISVKGSKQGQFHGETSETARRDKWIALVWFSMGLLAPRDAATGQAAGKREWRPVKIIKEWGAASPQGLAACATNEILSEVVVEFTRTNANGEEYVYQTVKLTNAVIDEVSRYAGEANATPPGVPPKSWVDTHELEVWSFTFMKIEVTDNASKESVSDNWMTS